MSKLYLCLDRCFCLPFLLAVSVRFKSCFLRKWGCPGLQFCTTRAPTANEDCLTFTDNKVRPCLPWFESNRVLLQEGKVESRNDIDTGMLCLYIIWKTKQLVSHLPWQTVMKFYLALMLVKADTNNKDFLSELIAKFTPLGFLIFMILVLLCHNSDQIFLGDSRQISNVSVWHVLISCRSYGISLRHCQHISSWQHFLRSFQESVIQVLLFGKF